MLNFEARDHSRSDRVIGMQRLIQDVAQDEERGERGGAPGARGGVALKQGSVG
jgi:hypothetical protein